MVPAESEEVAVCLKLVVAAMVVMAEKEEMVDMVAEVQGVYLMGFTDSIQQSLYPGVIV